MYPTGFFLNVDVPVNPSEHKVIYLLLPVHLNSNLSRYSVIKVLFIVVCRTTENIFRRYNCILRRVKGLASCFLVVREAT